MSKIAEFGKKTQGILGINPHQQATLDFPVHIHGQPTLILIETCW
jgi:hypothetical protein